MTNSSAELLITGIGMVSPLGIDWQRHCQSIYQGRHAFSPITSYRAERTPAPLAGVCVANEELNLPHKKLQKLLGRKDLMGVAAAYQALSDAGLVTQAGYNDGDGGGGDSQRRGVFIGAASSQMADLYPYFSSV